MRDVTCVVILVCVLFVILDRFASSLSRQRESMSGLYICSRPGIPEPDGRYSVVC